MDLHENHLDQKNCQVCNQILFGINFDHAFCENCNLVYYSCKVCKTPEHYRYRSGYYKQYCDRCAIKIKRKQDKDRQSQIRKNRKDLTKIEKTDQKITSDLKIEKT